MSLQFVFGASGSGKTEYLIRQILREAPKDFKKNWFLLVPEQDTLAMQKKVTGHPENQGKGMLNIDVLSFNRLAYHVFEELRLEDRPVLDDMGKVMILRLVAEKQKAKLQLYGNQLGRPGFLDDLKSQISEFYQYHIEPPMLDLAAEKAESAYTRAKLHDLALLYEAFRNYMDTHGYIVKEEILDRLYRHLPDSRFLQDSVVMLDGFTGFTPVQLQLLEEILAAADRVLVSCDVSLDASDTIYTRKGPEDLFYLSGETVKKLTEIAQRMDVPVLPAVNMNLMDSISGKERDITAPLPRFAKAPALDVLERRLYRVEAQALHAEAGSRGPEREKPKADASLAIWEAGDLRQEMEAIAGEIERDVHERGLRYQDIGMILTDPESYRDIIYKVFSEANIPYFFDDPGSLLDLPYAEILRSALEVVDRNFNFDSVLRYLRAFPTVTREERYLLDRFDNFLRARGIRGVSRYEECWFTESEEEGKRTSEEDMLRLMETVRVQKIVPLLAMRNATGGSGVSVLTRVGALQKLLADIGAAQAVQALSEQIRETEPNRASEMEKGIAAIDEVLQRMGELLQDTVVSRREFRDVLDVALSEASLRVIPATIDQVVIGDLTRSRFSAPRRFFVVGVTADQIPKAEADKKILTDRDRALFRSLSIELAPDRMEDALVQRFYIYRALLNPSEALVLSYPLKGRDGKGCKPSGLIGDIQKMFQDLKIRKLRNETPVIYTLKEAARFLAAGMPDLLLSEEERLSAEDGAWTDSPENELTKARRFRENARKQQLTYLALLQKSSEPEYREIPEQLFAAAFTKYTEDALRETTAKEVYGEMLTGSITRLEQYNQCAYAHFLRYGLHLSERENYEIRAFDLGTLYHTAIEHCFREAAREKRELTTYASEELDRLAVASVQSAAEEYNHGVMQDSARNRYLVHKVSEITRTTMWALSEQLKRGEFHVAELEQEFTYVRNGLRLKGRIDRVDLSEDESHVYVKVLDYKSGETKFSLQKVYNGQQLQLVTYMNQVLNDYQNRFPKKEVVPAAMLYYHIKDSLIDYAEGATPEEEALQHLRALKVEGLINTDMEVIHRLDRDAEKDSDVIKIAIKDGAVNESRHTVANSYRIRALGKYVEEKIRHCTKEIQSGRITIDPVQEDTITACTYCPYHAVCHFDRRLDGFDYKKLEKRDEQEIWNEIAPVQEEKEV